MIAELSVQHTYIAGGDLADSGTHARGAGRRRVHTGLGERADTRSSKIYQGQNEEVTYRSPLTEIGVDAKVGEYVLAIDGDELRGDDNPYRMLRDKADRPVHAHARRVAERRGSHPATYRPLTSETDLDYLDMVLANQKRVAQLSGGKVGYIHIPDMGAPGHARVHQVVLPADPQGGARRGRPRQRRRQRVTNAHRAPAPPAARPWTTRARATSPGRIPTRCSSARWSAILDEYSSSDGDIFPYMFRQAKLGPLIGKRSWGGVVGINDGVPADRRRADQRTESALASADGQWVIEGHGVDPDIEVENDAASVIAGKDNQLERAVQEVMKQMATVKHTLPPRPADKVRPRTP